jgi:GNAT superfamily N-acetyltransferase
LVAFRKRQLIDEGQMPIVDIDDTLRHYFLTMLTDENAIIWTATEQDEVIGIGCVYFFLYPPSFKNATGQTAYVHSMYTADAYRGQGVASRILSLIIDNVKKRNCKVIKLQASTQGKPVYEKIGFVESEGHMILRL